MSPCENVHFDKKNVHTSVHETLVQREFPPISHDSMSPCDQDHLSRDLDLEMIIHLGVGDVEVRTE